MNILSLGAGTQSTVMALMADRGAFGEKPDCAIFADTGWEPDAVYAHLDWLEEQLSYPVYRVQNGNILDSLLDPNSRYAAIPFYTESGGIGRRQCTNEYKIQPIIQKTRELLGVGPRKHVKTNVRQWIGISLDEVQRMKMSIYKWIENYYPLIDACMTRGDCINWFSKEYPGRVLPKSACLGCPFTSDRRWVDMKQNRPHEWAHVCEIDKLIRSNGPLRGMRDKQYIHRSRISLEDVNFATIEDQLEFDFSEECEGMCGV